MASPTGPHPRFFDLWSTVYDAPWVQRLTYKPVQDAVLRELRRAIPQRVLDIGCGTGVFTARMRDAFERTEVVGCDFSQGMLDQAASKRSELAWVRGDAQRLPFADARFDVIVSTESFHWFPDPDAALSELHRVLVPGGRLLVALINPRTEGIARAARLGSRLAGEPARWPTRARMRQRVESAGLRVESQTAILRLPAPLLLPCVLTTATRPPDPTG